jgi:DNA replication protein DnaC
MDAQPTIVTTNSDPARFAETFGARIFSRLADGAVVVRLGGEDRRRGA